MLLHPTRDPVPVLGSVTRWAARYGIAVVAAASDHYPLPPGIEPVALEQLLDRVDLLLAAGGDGTALQAMHLAAAQGVPVLAVNLGRLGYLADVDASRLMPSKSSPAGTTQWMNGARSSSAADLANWASLSTT
jgi:NAD+ kinase